MKTGFVYFYCCPENRCIQEVSVLAEGLRISSFNQCCFFALCPIMVEVDTAGLFHFVGM